MICIQNALLSATAMFRELTALAPASIEVKRVVWIDGSILQSQFKQNTDCIFIYILSYFVLLAILLLYDEFQLILTRICAYTYCSEKSICTTAHV